MRRLEIGDVRAFIVGKIPQMHHHDQAHFRVCAVEGEARKIEDRAQDQGIGIAIRGLGERKYPLDRLWPTPALEHDSVVAFGQKRALVVWQRIIVPDGSSIGLDNMPASDPSGYAGLPDKVDFHTWQLLKGVAISTMLGIGSDLQFSGNGGLIEAIRQSGTQNVSRVGEQLTAKELDIQPTLTIRPGAAVRLLVDKDLILAPWHG